ncbi:MAG: ABC transporter permease [Actinomycetota bacterium]
MTARRTILLVARREILERVRSRAFIVSTIFTLVLVAAFIVIPALLSGDDEPTAGGVTGAAAEELEDRIVALAPLFEIEVDIEAVTAAEIDKRLTDGDLDVVVSVDEIVVFDDLGDATGALLSTAAADVRRGDAPAPEQLELRRVSTADPDEDDRRQVMAFVSTFILLLVVNAYGATLMTGVLEEKSTRVVEVVLSAVPARWLLAGKLLGLGVLGLVQVLLIAATGGLTSLLVGDVELPGGFAVLLAAVVLWFVLGYAFYATGYAVAGSVVSRMEDAQAALTPVSTAVMGSYLLTVFVVLQNPASTASQILTLLPPIAPLAVPARLALDEIAVWEFALAAVLTMATIVGLVRLGGRLYSGSILSTGGRVSWRDAWSRAEL